MIEHDKTIVSMINKLSVDNEYDIEQKLPEEIFKFLRLRKIDQNKQERLIII